MSFKIFDKKERGLLNDDVVAQRYSEYLQQLIQEDVTMIDVDLDGDENVLSFDEFREYHVLNMIGRAKDFSENMARDYQNTAVLSDKLRFGK